MSKYSPEQREWLRQELVRRVEEKMKPYHAKTCTSCGGAGKVSVGLPFSVFGLTRECKYCEGSGLRNSTYWYGRSLGVEVRWE